MNYLIEMAAEVYDYHAQIGQEVFVENLCTIIRDAENPDVWSANKTTNIRLASPEEIPQLMACVEQRFSKHDYRVFSLDPGVPDFFSAYLVLNGYEEQIPTLQMVLEGDLASAPSALQITEVSNEEHWRALTDLVEKDHEEGGRTHGADLDPKIIQGIIDGYKKKSVECQFFLGAVGGVYCCYGSGLMGPNGMGMVEDLFTLPEYRKKGYASAIISCCVDFVRKGTQAPVLIGSHATDDPKYLYHKLGFEPVYLARSYVKKVS